MPELAEELAEQLVRTVRALRAMELKKAPSIAESIDWAHTLLALGLDTLDEEAVEGDPRRRAQARRRPGPRDQGSAQLKLPRAPKLCSTGTVEFTGACAPRESRCSTAETIDAVRALGKVDIVEREHLRAAFAATACKRAAAPADLRHPL